jgi:hypothetical protein
MPERTVMVWIEDGTGSIARGHADSVSGEGVRVRLAETPDFDEGDEVSVRICFERGAATIATTARVGGVRTGEDGVECDLLWTAPPEQRSTFDAWPAHAA